MLFNWYAVYTKHGLERRVSLALAKKGIESYCPVNRVVRQWDAFKRITYTPLFPSNVFIRFSEEQRAEVMKTPGIISLVYWRDKPAVIQDQEIDVMQKFLEEYKSVYLEKAPVATNATTRVVSSPIKRYFEGILSLKDNLIKVVLPSLGCILVAEVQKPALELLHQYDLRFFEINLQ